jgi:hypothetical protein
MIDKTAILQSARIAELRTAATELATLCQRPVPVVLAHSPPASRRCLLALLVRERRRNAKLVELLHG